MVFYVAIAIVGLFVIWGAVFPSQLLDVANQLLALTTAKFGWFYLIATVFVLGFSIYLAFSKYGTVRLGPDDSEPEFSDLTWFAMLFSAGMGIGLVFWGVAEPIDHYVNPPLGTPGSTPEAARVAMRYSFFHWGLQPWAIYSILGLVLAYFQFRKGAKGLISSTFLPLLGDRVNGPIGKTIDILAILATVFGVATSLGFGALQINGGLHSVFNSPISPVMQIGIMVVLLILYLLSSTTGLEKGIKALSNLNLYVAFALLLFTLLLGPTSFLFDTFTTTLGDYLQNLVQMSLRLTPFSGGTWVGDWTLFYWAWWIAWAPFVGMFIARVSKGRTIKEFVIGVMLVPSFMSFVWFSVFGGTALHFELFEHYGIAQAVLQDNTAALFSTLAHLPLGYWVSLLATLLIVTFFVTSADSATFVLGMLSSEGDLNPSNRVKITWGVLQAAIAVVLLLSGGLQALQTASIVTALPFSIIMLLMCYSIHKALRAEYKEISRLRRKREQKLDELILLQTEES
ncbi:BCCT family transporter [Tumebacillus sp. ITR2]|uniref:BCCT family transporter n=1 Tax=Tumebacillus amylolyticus TaxID=2801339 RepID=A0ABS1J5W1_9BACL|nr:BCCT family transporter [Tumebacillus amylolyticus]MBL0385659.1 BCCT family transporter [Tumebacillus amylolyticus]